MEVSQGQILKEPKLQELLSLFMTHLLIVMHAPVNFMNIFHTVKELWPGHEVGCTDRQMDVRDGQG